jgi:hypothetical protein
MEFSATSEKLAEVADTHLAVAKPGLIGH